MALLLSQGCSSGDNRQGTSAWEPGDTESGTGFASGDTGGDDGAEPDTGGDDAGATDSAEAPCEPGEVDSCLCPDGLHLGTHTCGDDGVWGPCGPCDSDDGGETGDTGGDDDGSSGGEALPEEVCYLGANSDYTTCFELHYFEADAMPDGYTYPGLFEGDINYRSPIAFIDLEAIDPSTAVAPNFVISELAEASDGRWAVVQPHAVESLQALRDTYGAITVFSAFRSPSYNAGIEGATYSRHMYGDGFDIALSGGGIAELEVGCGNEGGMLVEYNSHVHCDFRFEPVDELFFGEP